MDTFSEPERDNPYSAKQLTYILTCIEVGYETLNETYGSISELLQLSYTELKKAENYTRLPNAAVYLIGMLSATYHEIHTAKDLIERVIDVLKDLEG